MTAVFDDPSGNDGDWSEDEWRAWLAEAPPDPETGRAHPLTRATSSPSGSVLAAAMLGLERALYGERPQVELVAEATADDLDGGTSTSTPPTPPPRASPCGPRPPEGPGSLGHHRPAATPDRLRRRGRVVAEAEVPVPPATARPGPRHRWVRWAMIAP